MAKKSKLVSGMLVFGALLGTGLGMGTNQAQAKSRTIRVTSNRALKQAVTVSATGKNALFNKAGVLKNPRVIATKTTMRKMANSKNSNHYLRAYRVARLSNGSVYYKVVSFDGTHRGWVYGGKSTGKYASGIKKTTTTSNAVAPITTKTYQYKAGQKVWRQPLGSVYKNKQIVSDTSAYTGHDLKVIKAKRLKREGTVYYYVQNHANAKLNGWIASDGVVEKTTGSSNIDNNNQNNNSNNNGGGNNGDEQPGVTNPEEKPDPEPVPEEDVFKLGWKISPHHSGNFLDEYHDAFNTSFYWSQNAEYMVGIPGHEVSEFFLTKELDEDSGEYTKITRNDVDRYQLKLEKGVTYNKTDIESQLKPMSTNGDGELIAVSAEDGESLIAFETLNVEIYKNDIPVDEIKLNDQNEIDQYKIFWGGGFA